MGGNGSSGSAAGDGDKGVGKPVKEGSIVVKPVDKEESRKVVVAYTPVEELSGGWEGSEEAAVQSPAVPDVVEGAAVSVGDRSR